MGLALQVCVGFVIGQSMKECETHGITNHVLLQDSQDNVEMVCEICVREKREIKGDEYGF